MIGWGERKIHSGSTPRLGGIAIILGCLISQIYFLVDSSSMISNIQTYYYGLFVAILIFIVGVIDDLIEIDFYFKLIMCTLASSLIKPIDAYEFINNLNIQSVFFGASSEININEII
tara:strand:+ start:730 stop:1080 length:351 start_codon:yes stop_codon:yes gene_type:complete